MAEYSNIEKCIKENITVDGVLTETAKAALAELDKIKDGTRQVTKER